MVPRLNKLMARPRPKVRLTRRRWLVLWTLGLDHDP